ncbi:family 43 glycosylhydrolase [Ruminococcus flavefaciens]|uniref:family 43 glycosylhydrolase n=1 Tax=Ruminococcus flavefaciens TaxID=1265 RepID=UPI0004AE4148|nr:family 43 glycosylhydrolase [Ruminococcus flavefaciens]
MRKIFSAITAAALTAVTLCASVPAVTQAENPIVQTSFTPDPAPVVFGDELYVFTGCDREGNNDFYYMTGWQCFSTKDMKNWTDHGRILEDTSFSWCNANDAWASQCIERNGKYYFYFTTTNKGGGGRAIGVAVADSPEGPYSDPNGKPLCGPNWDYIDPTVIIDDDGQAWLMFGNPKCYYVKLKEDMVTLDGPIQQFDMNAQQFGSSNKGTTYGEGPWIYKHNNLYYLVWASFVDGFGGESQCYATGPSVTGPWTYRGVLQQGSNCFTTHGGIIDYKDHSYFFYHKSGIPGGGSYNRSASCEEFTYNADGTIPVMKLTTTGPDQLEPLNPFERVEAETICWSEGIKTEKDSSNSVNIGSIKKGAYIKVAGVDFGEGADKFTACVASAENGGNIELHLDSKTGPIVGNLKVGGTGGWQNWEEVSCDVAGADGEHDLYLVFNGGDGYLMNVDWWKFDGAGSSSTDTDQTYIFKNTFEGKLDGCSDRGGATVALSTDEAYEGDSSVYCSDRSASWKGVGKNLNYKFKAGENYSFSAIVKYKEGAPTTKFHLTLQYTGSDGETHYDKIDTKDVAKGEWAQLANTSYKIPEGAKSLLIYVETEGDSDDDTPATNFYVDNFFAAVDGTVIAGPETVVTPPTTEPPVQDLKEILNSKVTIWGDANADGDVDMGDVVLIMQSLANPDKYKLTEPGIYNADVSEAGGGITANDALSIQKYLLTMLTQLPESYSDNIKTVTAPATTTTTKVTTTTTTSTTTTTTASIASHLSMKDFTAKVQANIVEKEPDSANQSKNGVTYGEIQKKTYYSNTCKRNKKYNVLLPPNYDPNKKYPVMYILHGYYENPDRMLTTGNAEMHTREMLGNAIAEGAAKEMICVFPDVYSSATQDAVTGMDDNNNRAYDNFINQLKNDLMPEIEKNYSVLTGKDNTAITGFSMGGRESLLIGMQMSDKIGYIGAICPAPGVTGSFKWDSSNEPYFLMITAGSNDQTVGDNPRSYHNSFEKNGVPHIWHYVNGGYHGDNCIRAHLYNFFRIAFQN